MPNQLDLTADEKRVLDYLDNEKEQYEDFIAQALKMEDDEVVRAIDGLEYQELVERETERDRVRITGNDRM